jgi:hypothetical protein
MNAQAALTLPWDPDEAIIPNLTIGSMRDSILKWLAGTRGVHAETLMVTIGALAGFAAQNAALRSFGPPGTPANGAVYTAEAGGERYYFGDRINGYLVQQNGEYAYPLWGFVAAAAMQTGLAKSELPNVVEMFDHISKSIGKPAFGLPRTTKDHPFHLTPRQALEKFWPLAKTLLSNADGILVRGLSGLDSDPEGHTSVPEVHWPLVMALVAQQFMKMVKGTLDPRLSFSLIMESAIMMSKVDPTTIPQIPPPVN